MKFKIRHADQIVGILAITAILALVLTIFLLGSRQRWFARDYQYMTTFESASGLSAGMPVLYKGFTIGKITSISLNDTDMVEISFVIYDTYNNRVREGSVVELLVNPLGLGNQFLFHPGLGETVLAEGSHIPRSNSPEGLSYIAMGRVIIPRRDDTISNILAQVNPFLTQLNETLSIVNGAIDGSGSGPLADTMTNATTISDELAASMGTILDDISSITANLEILSEALSDPRGLVPTLVDPDGSLFESIENSLQSVEGTLNNLEDSSEILKFQFPQLARLIEDIRIAIVQGQDVLEGLRNNPLIRGGIPERGNMNPAAANSQNIDF